MLLIVISIPKHRGLAFSEGLGAEFVLKLCPFLERQDDTCAKGDLALSFELVEIERPHGVVRRREAGTPAAVALLDEADRHLIGYAQRAVIDDPTLFLRHAARFHA